MEDLIKDNCTPTLSLTLSHVVVVVLIVVVFIFASCQSVVIFV